MITFKEMYEQILRSDTEGEWFTPSQIESVLSKIFKTHKNKTVVKKDIPWTKLSGSEKSGKKRYLNIPASFDIETTSLYVNGKQYAGFMYCWQFCLCGYVFIGRTWDQYGTFLKVLKDFLRLNMECRLLVYVHNLSFEFQFLRKEFPFFDVFSRETRAPIYAVSDGIEYRCSYMLTNSSLAKVGENLIKYKVQKRVGDIDYKKIRHSQTPLTKKELGYCINDVLVVVALIMERIERDGDISKIPLTQTGYVRRYVRKECLPQWDKEKTSDYFKYKKLMSRLTLTSEEYFLAKKAKRGGKTHCNVLWTGSVAENVKSMDFTSSYPYVLISEKYPMGTGKKIDPRTIKNRSMLDWYCEHYCVLFGVVLKEVKAKYANSDYLSSSLCYDIKKGLIDNGCVVEAEELTTYITDVDYEIIKECYDFKSIQIGVMWVYPKRYLPKPIIEAILYFYELKTTLKDVEGKEEEYQRAKEMLNCIFGMMLTEIIQEETVYDNNEWQSSNPLTDEEKAERLEDDYNENDSRFLSYLWGVWCTAYARRNLMSGVIAVGDDGIYTDTDSLKFVNYEKHKEYFDMYNKMADLKLLKASKEVGFDFKRTRPKTVEGVEKPLGRWDNDGDYTRFKSLGAKRYMTESWKKNKKTGKMELKLSMTVSGVNKKEAIPYLLEEYNNDNTAIFEAFDDGLKIPKGKSGKLTHKYIDIPITADITDYLGNTHEETSLSSVYLEDAEYSLGLAGEYKNFLKMILTKEYTYPKM